MRRVMRTCGVAALLLIGAVSARAQAPADEAKIVLPSNPAQWINSRPISTEAIAGKSVVLYFFEEG
ncbi:MAG: hypothetical protein NXI04_27045 [Planctomycetaceae bacterium]|nr:hypothetical protein [Planctomycetaceae bacterium]